MHHWDGGPDPTELLDSAQQVFHRPTGACHTSHIIPPSRLCAALAGRKQRLFPATMLVPVPLPAQR